MGEAARATSNPISAGEKLKVKYEFQRVREYKAASILPSNVCCWSGLSSLQLSATTPKLLIGRTTVTSSECYADMLTTKRLVKNGNIMPSRQRKLVNDLGLELTDVKASARARG